MAQENFSSQSPQSRNLVVKAESVTRKFGGVTAVNSVSLEVFHGELVGIMGPNGAGKSTFLSLLSGTRPPSSGSLEVCGKDFSKIKHSDAAHIGVGLAHQIPKPFRKLTVRQNVEIASYVLPRSCRKEIVEHALEITGLSNRAGKNRRLTRFARAQEARNRARPRARSRIGSARRSSSGSQWVRPRRAHRART